MVVARQNRERKGGWLGTYSATAAREEVGYGVEDAALAGSEV